MKADETDKTFASKTELAQANAMTAAFFIGKAWLKEAFIEQGASERLLLGDIHDREQSLESSA